MERLLSEASRRKKRGDPATGFTANASAKSFLPETLFIPLSCSARQRSASIYSSRGFARQSCFNEASRNIVEGEAT